MEEERNEKAFCSWKIQVLTLQIAEEAMKQGFAFHVL
jgi:hypothetical protein